MEQILERCASIPMFCAGPPSLLHELLHPSTFLSVHNCAVVIDIFVSRADRNFDSGSVSCSPQNRFFPLFIFSASFLFWL